MKWRLSRRVKLANARISKQDSDRQMRTARQILRRFDDQPGVILADEVGMGKTFVALAVAVSVIEANRGKQPVIVMVPPAVQNKWPRDWTFFSQVLLRGDMEIKATSRSINRGGQFLKLLDDPDPRRHHLIFLTHGALTNSLADPFVRLGIIRRALRRPTLKDECRVFPRWAYNIIPFRDFRDEKLVTRLLEKSPRHWRSVYRRLKGRDLDDDPLPEALYSALYKVDLSELIVALKLLPQKSSSHLKARLQHVTGAVRSALNSLWKECLREVNLRLPLLILDEAHHLKNPQTILSSLFANKQAEQEAKLLRGPLGGVFDRMLFLTATPFQLGHHELINVLQRFEGIRWGKKLDRKGYQKKLHKLETALNVAQTAALRLDRVWGKLTQEDFESGDGGRWWEKPDNLPQPARQALRQIEDVEAKIKTAESLLKPWVIRHARPDLDTRRTHRSGRAILGEMEQDSRGLQVTGSAVLPFLLASRAQAVVAAEGHRYSKQTRAYFSEGLVSSFEAYRDTRLRREPDKLMDDALLEDGGELSQQARWYLEKIDQALSSAFDEVWDGHPKIEATVQRVLELWREGEKVLVFCFYRATGRALRNHISQALERELLHRGAEWLQIDASDEERVRRELDLFGDRFFDPDSPVTLLARSTVNEIFSVAEIPDQDRIRAVDVVLRFLRTPSFLVRYLQQGVQDREEGLSKAFSVTDQSGRSLRQKIKAFAQLLDECIPEEREELLTTLQSIQTGSIFGNVETIFDPGERAQRREKLLPNVRLANGEVKRETRQRLMLAFNTPFFPEVLVASSVMAEGVDLHLHCRHVIHHDLDWNPSVLEQRTGRLDRLGSKSEKTKLPIMVDEPFIEATQDERQFRVVKDRLRWFNVVMGERLQLDEWSISRMAERVPLPKQLAERMTMKLDLPRS